MKYIIRNLLLLILALTLLSCSSIDSKVKKEIDERDFLENYELVWEENFEKDKLNEDKWEYFRLNQTKYKNKNLRIKDNNLEIKTEMKNGKYYLGAINSKKSYLYGYFEAKIKLQKEKGHWSAFWLLPKGGFRKTKGSEIDIMEYFEAGSGEMKHTVHWLPKGAKKHESEGEKVKSKYFDTGYHTFGVKWTPEKYEFFVNNIKTGEITKGTSNVPVQVILSSEVNHKVTGPVPEYFTSDSFYVDYVRVYQEK